MPLLLGDDIRDVLLQTFRCSLAAKCHTAFLLCYHRGLEERSWLILRIHCIPSNPDCACCRTIPVHLKEFESETRCAVCLGEHFLMFAQSAAVFIVPGT